MPQSPVKVYKLPNLGIRVVTFVESADYSVLAYTSHKHAFYELQLIEQGTVVFEVEKQLYTVNEGQFFLVAPGVEHSPISDLAGTKRFCFKFELSKDPAPLRDYLKSHLDRTSIGIGPATNLTDTISKLRTELECQLPFSEEIRQVLYSHILLEITRMLETTEISHILHSASLDDTRTIMIERFLQRNFHLSSGEDALAEELGISRRQLNRIFKKLYGVGFREKMQDIRLRAACAFLTRTDKSIQEISEQIGYSSPSNFIAFFRSAYGITPLQYRKNSSESTK